MSRLLASTPKGTGYPMGWVNPWGVRPQVVGPWGSGPRGSRCSSTRHKGVGACVSPLPSVVRGHPLIPLCSLQAHGSAPPQGVVVPSGQYIDGTAAGDGDTTSYCMCRTPSYGASNRGVWGRYHSPAIRPSPPVCCLEARWWVREGQPHLLVPPATWASCGCAKGKWYCPTAAPTSHKVTAKRGRGGNT